MKYIIRILIPVLVCFFSWSTVYSQSSKKAHIALIQATALPIQDPFLETYEPALVRPQMEAHLDKLLGLFEKAGEMGADLVCGPEDMQHIGAYGLHIDKKDPVTGKVLFSGLAVQVPGPLTDRISAIAKRYGMYIIAPLYESAAEKVYNTAVLFDRNGEIVGRHRKTLVPVMETWLVSTGDDYEVYETDFANISIAICWELWYPEISMIYALKGADIIFNPTMAKDNFPGKSLETAHTFITRARDNSVYIAPVVLGKDGNGILDFDGNVIAESVGEEDVVIMTEIDFSQEKINSSKWWEAINGTNNARAIYYKSRRPETYQMLTDPNPPVLKKYEDIHLTTGDRERQLEAVRKVDYGPKKK